MRQASYSVLDVAALGFGASHRSNMRHPLLALVSNVHLSSCFGFTSPTIGKALCISGSQKLLQNDVLRKLSLMRSMQSGSQKHEQNGSFQLHFDGSTYDATQAAVHQFGSSRKTQVLSGPTTQ
jgi:hypothetical protein